MAWLHRRTIQTQDAENPAEAGLPAQTFRTAVSIAGGPSYDEIVRYDVRYSELLLWALDAPPHHRAVIEELIATAMACPGPSIDEAQLLLLKRIANVMSEEWHGEILYPDLERERLYFESNPLNALSALLR